MFKLTTDNSVDCESFQDYDIDKFGDKDVEIYELGENDTIQIGSEKKYQQTISQEAYCTIQDYRYEGTATPTEVSSIPKIEFDEVVRKTTGFSSLNSYTLETYLFDDRWDSSSQGAGHIYRPEVLEERRGIYFTVYYGQKELPDETKIVDVNYNEGALTLLGDEDAKFTGVWESVDGETNVDWGNVAYTSCVTVGSFIIWPPSVISGVASIATSIIPHILDLGNGGPNEKAAINTCYIFLINRSGESGVTSTLKDARPSISSGPFSPDIKGSGRKTWKNGGIMDSREKRVKFGDSIIAYTCAVVWCQAASTSFPFEAEVKAKLEYSFNRNVNITPQ